MGLHQRLNLRPHEHSGRHLPHSHTSYAALAFLVLITGVVLATITSTAQALTQTGVGSIGLSGQVLGPAPSTAASIDQPTEGQRFTDIPITVAGSCTKDTFIEIYSNDSFAGSAVCSDSGRYSLVIDLFDGANRLVAKTSNAAGQTGPDSRTINVFYSPTRPTTADGAPLTQQLQLTSEHGFATTFPDKEIVWSFAVKGGQPPYAINVAWGDETESLVSRSAAGDFTAKHTYTKAGNYNVVVRAIDASGEQAFLQVVTIVNGTPESAGTTQINIDRGRLEVLWPLYALVLLMLLSFWLGERYRQYRLQKRGLLAPTA